MKKLFAFLSCAILAASIYFVSDVSGAARAWVSNTITVSTTTVTAIKCGTYNLTGRKEIRISNIDATYTLEISSSPNLVAGGGWEMAHSSTTITLPLTEGTTVYGLGQANATDGTVDVSVIELK